MGAMRAAPRTEPVIAAEHVVVHYGGARQSARVHAVNGVSLSVAPGEIVGLVGESGCGKSTLARMLVGIETATSGVVTLDGEPVVDREVWRELRRRVQYVFQDPYGALCPTMTIGETLTDALAINGVSDRTERSEKATRMLEQVGLAAGDLNRYPRQFSGGQRQRIGLARALVLEPELIICDEIVSGLDVSVQAQILNLLSDLQQRLGVALLFISHDLRVVRYLCDRVVVMYLGKFVEEGRVDDVFSDPRHPYTRGLLASVPDHAPDAAELKARVTGEPTTLLEIPVGCPFAPRCELVQELCLNDAPALEGSESHRTACHFAGSDLSTASRRDETGHST